MSTPAHALCALPQLTDVRVLLVEADRWRARNVAKVLRSAVADIEIAVSVPDGRRLEEWDLLVISDSALPSMDRTCLPTMPGTGNMLILSGDASSANIGSLVSQHGLCNLLAVEPPGHSEDLLATVQKIFRKDIFGIEKYFPWGSTKTSLKICSSEDRSKVVDEALKFAQTLGVQQRMADLFRNVADELTSNALYNAPVDASGRARFSSLPRTQAVRLDAGEEVEACFCSDGRRIGISVTDPFGSLTPQRIRDRLSKCFERGDDQVDEKGGGAGLGIYMTLESLSHFIVNLERDRRTEFIGLMDVQGSYRDFALKGKSFNIFVDERVH